jgi:hypothetical protein
LEQDFGNVKVIPSDVASAVEGPLRSDLDLPPADGTEKVWRPPADQARIQILATADGHIAAAVEELRAAVDWFAVVDRTDHADLVRQVETLADTIAYRLRNAGE